MVDSLTEKSKLMRIFREYPIIEKDPFLRGYYISADDCGTNYLYEDGEIRSGVSDHNAKITSFWKTKKDAKAFYQKWKKDQ